MFPFSHKISYQLTKDNTTANNHSCFASKLLVFCENEIITNFLLEKSVMVIFNINKQCDFSFQHYSAYRAISGDNLLLYIYMIETIFVKGKRSMAK